MSRVRGPAARCVAAVLGLAACALMPALSLAQEAPVRLALAAVDQPGAWFDLTMGPGDRRTVTVDLFDPSSVALPARTYATDVYTIVNGGFGGRLRGEPQTAMTTWLDYPAEVLQLEPGQHVRRSVAISVPSDGAPGEYISSIVLENDVAVQGSGSVALGQIVRQAVAVVVTVPGVRAPRLTIGAAVHRVVAGNSVISVAVGNPGNIRLRPTVGFALFDASNARISATGLQMDTFYARTDSTIEVPFAARLLPGAYSVRLTLDDSGSGARAEEPAIPLIVDAVTSDPAGVASGPQLVSVDQSPGPTGVSVGPAVVAALLHAILAPGAANRVVVRSRQRRTVAHHRPSE
ncbi:MAG: hypothetical protein QOF49_1, partial [Chloroflexota bacterium]|nr:hypothetical protein [Chloroflexota bacterium]